MKYHQTKFAFFALLGMNCVTLALSLYLFTETKTTPFTVPSHASVPKVGYIGPKAWRAMQNWKDSKRIDFQNGEWQEEVKKLQKLENQVNQAGQDLERNKGVAQYERTYLTARKRLDYQGQQFQDKTKQFFKNLDADLKKRVQEGVKKACRDLGVDIIQIDPCGTAINNTNDCTAAFLKGGDFGTDAEDASDAPMFPRSDFEINGLVMTYMMQHLST